MPVDISWVKIKERDKTLETNISTDSSKLAGL